jgi:hypothetical protein
VSPPEADTSGAGAEPGAASGSLEVGGYVLQVGSAAGTVVQRSAGPTGEGPEPLQRVLAEREPKSEDRAAAAAAKVVDDASEVTTRVERAVALGKGVAEGKARSPEQLALEVGTLLDLLERLDRRGKYKEALRLARALANLLMLLRRWAELLRTLRTALRAGEKLEDLKVVGWAKHELGTLRIAAGDVEGAERDLREAREIRERVGDQRGLAATNRNLQVLCERLREMLRDEELVRAHGRRPSLPRLLSLAVLLALLFGGGVAAGVIASDSNDASTTNGPGGGGTIDADGGTTNDTGGGPDSFSLLVTIAGDGGGTVEGEGIQCADGTCEAKVPAGEEVTLVAVADDGSVFEGFSGACSGTEACPLAMTATRSVTATFGRKSGATSKEEIVEQEEKAREEREREAREKELSEEETPPAPPEPSE